MREKVEISTDRVPYAVAVLLLVLVPITFSATAYRIFTLPKFMVLVIGTALLSAALALYAARHHQPQAIFAGVFDTRHLTLAVLFILANFISAIFGIAPMPSFLGSFENQMGFITRLCFFIVFIGLCVSIKDHFSRLRGALWAVSLVGLIISAYALVQFFGRDPFLSANLYAFDGPQGVILRVISSIGHSNYLGNFLLYTTPVSFALAVAARGRERRVLGAGAFLSTSAIVISGTRGAWLGLLIGAAIFFALECVPKMQGFFKQKKKVLVALGLLLVLALAVVWIAGSSRYANTVKVRLQAIKSEGFTGSGRTLLWRDSLKMVPRYLIAGCGAEGYRKAFLAYRSKELAQLAPQINNESPHNAYLDGLISSGLLGGLAYTLLVASSLFLLIQARRKTKEENLKTISGGLIASLAAVALHNFFIFDQITTGLYFFAFAAFAQVAFNIANRADETITQASTTKANLESAQSESKKTVAQVLAYVCLAASVALLGLAVWYSYYLFRLDMKLKQAAQASSMMDIQKVIQTEAFFEANSDFDGTHNFMLAQILTVTADRLTPKPQPYAIPVPEPEDNKLRRYQVIDLAIKHTERSLRYSLVPDSVHLLQAYLYNARGDAGGTEKHALETLKLDPYSANGHWLLAASTLARGDNETAIKEVHVALEINPNLIEARQVLREARGIWGSGTPEEVIKRALAIADQGKIKKARRLALHAKRLANGECPICDQTIATIAEREKK
jgi:O-antigen ligase